MPVRVGSQQISAIRVGTTALNSIRVGSTLVWSATNLFDDFDYADGPLDPALWTEISSSGGVFSSYKLGVDGGAARLRIPDQTGFWLIDLNTSYYRFIPATAGDDGYVETRIANSGSRDYKTRLGRRVTTDGAAGVFMQFDSGMCRLVRRVANANTTIMDCGSITSGDIMRLAQLGNLHTVTRNGALAAEWNDSGATAAKGASYRSIAMYAEGLKDLLGPRRFSPSLDYIEAM